jgi:hypothetical protein
MRSHLAGIVRTALLITLLEISACSGSSGTDDGSGEQGNGTCGLRADVTGGTTIHFTGKDDAACATLHASGTGLDGQFIGVDAKGTLELMVDDITEAETGSDYPTRVLVTSTAKEHWQGAGCLTSVNEHQLLKTEASTIGELRHYQLSGSGSCVAPLDSVPVGGEAVSVSEFVFRAQFIWRD